MADGRPENVRRLIPKAGTPAVKPPMYRSAYTDAVRRTYAAHMDRHRTMGHARVRLDPPDQFLRKRAAAAAAATVPAGRPCKCSGKSAPENPPPRTSRATGRHDKPPPPPSKHRVQDTRDGHVIVLDEAGLEPAYVSKANYGRTPAYIVKMHLEMETAKRTEAERKRAVKPPLRQLPEDERNELLNGLKANRAELHKEFLLLPVLTDTVPKVKRKTALEKQLNDLEKDIDLLERNPSIYVRQDR